MANNDQQNHWTEDLSKAFLNYGRFFVPEREHQMHVITGLLAGLEPGANIVDLCCGEGLLSETILNTYPSYSVRAFDGSTEMLGRARKRLSRFKNRLDARLFDLASTDWRIFTYPVHAIISSLAIHHLIDPQKQGLFKDIYSLVAPGGLLVIADVLEVVSPEGKSLAAEEWDRAVRQRSLELEGNDRAYEFFKNEGWNMHRYLDPEDIDKPSPIFNQLKWLEQAGFVDIDVNWLFAGHVIFSGRKSRGAV